MRLAGGSARFGAVEISARTGAAVELCQILALDALDSAAAALPPQLRGRFDILRQRLTMARQEIAVGDAVLRFDRPQVMGILNVTPDSFSDGGRHNDPGGAAAAARAMIAAGAALVDVGGESTRPRAPHVPLSIELARVGPVLDLLQGSGLPLSIDTRQAAVMARALATGAGMVNDVSALGYDPAALALIAASGCPV
ncbi:MAG: dihydropteroate synthase, partial [Polymorphobacter sp.]